VNEYVDDELDEDAIRRIESLRDPTRTGDPGPFRPSPTIGTVACRGRCGARVEWTESAEDAFVLWNRILGSRRELPLDRDVVVFCASCRTTGIAMQGDRNRKAACAMRDAIRELRDCTHPQRERDLVERIKKLGHPDADGLVSAIRERRQQQRPGRTREL
jgi:hypothetical protein